MCSSLMRYVLAGIAVFVLGWLVYGLTQLQGGLSC